jgi:hypothetical protein
MAHRALAGRLGTEIRPSTETLRRKGAALNAVQIAERLADEYLH